MYKLTFELKQHTPIIHFQHEQEGATLRASEVKPKLDKFIITKIGEGDYELGKRKINTNWVINKANVEVKKRSIALNYKVTITDQSSIAVDIPDPYPCFFGNMGEDISVNQKKFMFSDKVYMTITTLNKAIFDCLVYYIVDFFCCTNFGTRGSKGFGCYSIYKSTKHYECTINDFENSLKNHFGIIYKFQWTDTSNLDIMLNHNNLFKKIETEYKILKAGVQKKDSRIKIHFNNQRPAIEWEKPAIQQNIELITGSTLKNIKKINDNFFYVRALLGLAENFEYPKQSIKVKIEHNAVGNNKIQRYRSPITVKVFENYFYFCPEPIPEDVIKQLRNEEFILTFEHDKTIKKSMSLTLKVPGTKTLNKSNFDIYAFLATNLKQPIWTILK